MKRRIRWWFKWLFKSDKFLKGCPCGCCLFCNHFERCVEDNSYIFEKGGIANGKSEIR